MVAGCIPVREFEAPWWNPKINDPHCLTAIKDLRWPCYDVMGWDGERKHTFANVARADVGERVDDLREEHPNIGVVGVQEVCPSSGFDARLIALGGAAYC